jgi:hypothetical protein
MLRFVSRHKKLTAFSALAILIFANLAWDASAFLRGQIVARYDIARGHYRELTLGLPPPQRPTYANVIKERYGIELRAVAGCIVSPSLISYVDGYNSVSIAGANRKWGRDVFEDGRNEAGRIWSQAHPQPGLPAKR